jgi:hypothetical protein
MWICLNNAFLSIVNHPDDTGMLLVRARRKGDIEVVFGDQWPVTTLPKRDYRFRASIPRAVVGRAIAGHLEGIDYGNFKNSVRDAALHDAYATVWGVMAQLQEVPPYGSRPRPGFDAHPVR